MMTDSIVEETRAIRDAIAARFDYDIQALGEYFKSKRMTDVKVMIDNAAQTAAGNFSPTLPVAVGTEAAPQ